jgi:CheY-like chemotaxis protein
VTLQAAPLPIAPYVFVVDDTPAIREVVVELLREEGVRAVGFANGAEALEHLRSNVELPSAIITDLMMPVLDGWELVEALRADETLSRIHVVAMTANAFCRPPARVRVLRKPFHVADLLRAMEMR